MSSFVPPPEAPVFRPTSQEFRDPLAYIDKIRSVAQRAGICKIIPPVDWNPPFSVDVDKFRFTPRVQRLNELEAKTRIKLNFLDHLAKFWELQGLPLKIPLVDNKHLDLHALYKAVNEDDLKDAEGREHNWAKIASRLHYPSGKGIGNILRQYYEKILFPYDIFLANQKTSKDNSGGSDNSTILPLMKRSKTAVKNKLNKSESSVQNTVQQSVGISSVVKTESLNGGAGGSSKESKLLSDVKTDIQIKVEANAMIGANPSLKEDKFDMESLGNSETKPNADAAGIGGGGKISNELRRLLYYGAGPKAAVPDTEPESVINESSSEISLTTPACEQSAKPTRMKTRVRGRYPTQAAMRLCDTCNAEGDDASLIVCDDCDQAFHLFCLVPPLSEIPRGDWRCLSCISEVCHKTTEVITRIMVYGFETATREYTLQSFGIMADQFKRDYFNSPVHLISCAAVEKEFWRLVNCIEEDVVVEYGADIHASECGSGFPTAETSDGLEPEDQNYVTAGWNLNNLPSLPQSVLRYINVDISGMKVPWCYVGMCFTSFAWHNEDHWSYSVNYLHWGEPKTWYGVPGAKAELLEECMKRNAPELFEQSPDLLHQLTTIMNPNTLMEFGVPVVRTNQSAGEYVVTFPRAYHAGFNQGYNFAEAVNFCTADWLPLGRACIDHYRTLKRQCVFSHEELLSKMSMVSDDLSYTLVLAVHQDLVALVEREKEARKKLLSLGICEAEKEAFELLPDDERQCFYCNTTCFFSAITCSCSESKLVCVQHADKLCQCPTSRLCLRYRYTLDDLLGLLHRLRRKEMDLTNWTKSAQALLEPNRGSSTEQKCDINKFEELIKEARDMQYPSNTTLDALLKIATDANKCSAEIGRIVCCKLEPGKSVSISARRSTLQDLYALIEQIDALPCTIEDAHMVRDLLMKAETFQAEVNQSVDTADSTELQRLLIIGSTMAVEVPELEKVRQRLRSRTSTNCITAKKERNTATVTATPQKRLKNRVANSALSKRRAVPVPAESNDNATRNVLGCSDVAVTTVGYDDAEIMIIDEEGDELGKGEIKEPNEQAGEKCSAERCLKPTVSKVEWIQCDICQCWFHFFCVGLDRENFGERDDYMCHRCSSRSTDDALSLPVISDVVSLVCSGEVDRIHDSSPAQEELTSQRLPVLSPCKTFGVVLPGGALKWAGQAAAAGNVLAAGGVIDVLSKDVVDISDDSEEDECDDNQGGDRHDGDDDLQEFFESVPNTDVKSNVTLDSGAEEEEVREGEENISAEEEEDALEEFYSSVVSNGEQKRVLSTASQANKSTFEDVILVD